MAIRGNLVCIFIILIIFGSNTLLAKTKPIICSEENSWANAEERHQIKNQIHYFVGVASVKETIEAAEEQALSNAIKSVSEFIRVAAKTISKDYRSTESEGIFEMATKTTGAQITMRYDVVNSCSGGTEKNYNAAVKIAISDEEIQRMRIKDKGATDWNFKILHCNDRQFEEVKQIFRAVADKSNLNWNLRLEQTEKPDFKKIPETAYFAEIEAKCDGKITSMSIQFYDLIENVLVRATPGYAKGSTSEELMKDLFKKLKLYTGSGTWIPNANSEDKGENIPSDLLFLISDATNFEKKWKLDPEKATKLWQNIIDYGKNNPYQDKAKNEINIIKKYISSISELSSQEKKDYENLKTILNEPSFNTDILCEQISRYIVSYGALVGTAKIDKLFNFVKDKAKSKQIRTKVFSDKIKSWQEGCDHGDPAKCYIVSMKNDRESIKWKKMACERQVEKACFDLYSMERNKKHGKNAVVYAEQSCYLGNKEACFHAAWILFAGKEMNAQPNVNKSIELLEDSCFAGFSKSCYMLGALYDEHGTRKIPTDKEKSREFYDKACKLGVKEACK